MYNLSVAVYPANETARDDTKTLFTALMITNRNNREKIRNLCKKQILKCPIHMDGFLK
jgi:hypothetical protein